jgi:hypothetical protein
VSNVYATSIFPYNHWVFGYQSVQITHRKQVPNQAPT